MINIAICDDNEILLNNFKGEILAKSKQFGREVKLTTFIEERDFINLFNENNNNFDIVFLDIDMPNIGGFQMAEYIRKYNNKVIIIFLTSMENLVYDSFKYNPLRFIRKKQFDLELEEGLVAAFIQVDKNNNYYIFKTYDGNIKLIIDDIIYIECVMRKIHVITFNKKYQLVGYKFYELANELKKRGFIMTHRTLIVNMEYIFSIGTNEVILDNGKKLNLSRYRANDVKQALARFIQ